MRRQGLQEVESTWPVERTATNRRPAPGPSWKCPECGTTLRLGEHHSGGRHVVLFVDGKPTLYVDKPDPSYDRLLLRTRT